MHTLLPVVMVLLGMCLYPFVALSQQVSEAVTEESIHKTHVGETQVWIIAPTWRDQPASVLLPQTEEHKKAIASLYPKGNMRNALNVMLVRGKDYLALIDTGLPNTVPALLAGIASAGFSPDDITHVIITHAHGDHTGGLSEQGKAVFPKARVIFNAKELDYWMEPAHKAHAPERSHSIFSQLPQILAPYAGRIDTTAPETDVLPGLRILPAYGHTPGHVAVLVYDGHNTRRSASHDPLLFWADLMHGMLVQLPYPDVAASYDIDPVLAIAARKTLLERAKAEGWRFCGVHVPGLKPWPPLQ